MSKFGKSPLRIKIYITILCIAVLASLGTLCAFAEDETVPAEYGEFISATPDEVLDKLPSGALSQKVGEVEQAARELTSPARILGLLLETFEVGIKEMLPTLALILCTVILSALVSVIAKSVSSSLCVTVEACARICSFCAILGASALSVESVTEYFNGLFSSVAAFIPLSTVLYAMGGNFTAAGGGAVSLNLILGVCQFFCTQTAVPFFCRLSLPFSYVRV